MNKENPQASDELKSTIRASRGGTARVARAVWRRALSSRLLFCGDACRLRAYPLSSAAIPCERSRTGEIQMIPGPDQYISLLMGAPSASDKELTTLGVEVLKRFEGDTRGLLVPADSSRAYKQLIREKLEPGFWNDLVGADEIIFLFKLLDGTVVELTLSESNRAEIARLCSSLNGDPIEKTSDIPAYFAANPFYREAMVEYYGADVT